MILLTAKRIFGTLAALALIGAGASRAEAGLITGTFYQYDDTDARNATVTRTGTATEAVPFNVSTLDYNNQGSANTLGNFLGQDAPPAHADDSIQMGNGDSSTGSGNAGSYFLFRGSVFLTQGSHTFSITHDDGAQLLILGTTFGTTTPTTQITETETLTARISADNSFVLGYGEINGRPAVLNFSIDGKSVVSTPEPSTMVGAASALVCTAGLAWRRRRRAIAQPA